MSETTQRYYSQRALELLDVLDTHVAPRRPKDEHKVLVAIDDLRRILCRLAGASTTGT